MFIELFSGMSEDPNHQNSSTFELECELRVRAFLELRATHCDLNSACEEGVKLGQRVEQE